MRRAHRVVLAVLGALAVAVVPAAPAGAQQDRDPILFVHGWAEAEWVWHTMIDRFRDDGWSDAQLHNWSYDTAQSNRTTAEEVRTKVEAIRAETGAAQVDLVTHSMGGLNTRWYIRFLGGDAHVDDWVSLGGPNHGTDIANLCSPALPSCREMEVGSDFLTELNAGDETPGEVSYGTFWSPCDEIIWPQRSVLLDGATNTRTGCVGHISLTQHPEVYPGVRDFVR